MSKENIIYSQWLPYTEYEKQFCSIKTKDGKQYYFCYPNAGKFQTSYRDNNVTVNEADVVEIYYLSNKEIIEIEESLSDDPFNNEEYFKLTNIMLNYQLPTGKNKNKNVIPQEVPLISNKISRNSLCTCGSGKKYKKCCL